MKLKWILGWTFCLIIGAIVSVLLTLCFKLSVSAAFLVGFSVGYFLVTLEFIYQQ